MLAAGTKCTCGTIKTSGTEKDVHFPARYCPCTETAGYFSFTSYKCTKYPALAPSSKCTIDTTAFPKVIRCDYALVIGTDDYQATTTLSAELKVGYGSTGAKGDLVAELGAGIFTSQAPEPCPIIPMTGVSPALFPNLPEYMFGSSTVNAAMALCNMMKYVTFSLLFFLMQKESFFPALVCSTKVLSTRYDVLTFFCFVFLRQIFSFVKSFTSSNLFQVRRRYGSIKRPLHGHWSDVNGCQWKRNNLFSSISICLSQRLQVHRR